MEFDPLLAISPLDGRYYTKLNTLRPLCSEYGLIRYRLLIEIQWLIHLVRAGDIISVPQDLDCQTLENIIIHFDIQVAERIKQIEQTTNHDVKAVEYFLQEALSAEPTLIPLIPFIHFGATSADINNLAYALMLQDCRRTLSTYIQEVITLLNRQAQQYASIAMLSRTHGQPASPTTLGKELVNFSQRLNRELNNFNAAILYGKWNGAVGNYNAHLVAYPDYDWPALSARFINHFGLTINTHTTQIEPHDFIATYCHHLSRINTICIDLSRDLWQYISLNYFTQQTKADEVGSSTMPHKVNPIDFENAEGNLGVANALAMHLSQKLPVSRLQRDLSNSTVLRNLGVICGHSLLAYQALAKGLNKLKANPTQIQQDLASHWELLAEPIQMVLRANGITDAYQQLKDLTRDKVITRDLIMDFISQCDINPDDKARLLALTPENYIGLAVQLTQDHT